MKLSGWSEKFRMETIQSGVIGYERQCQVSDNGGTPLHRPQGYQAAERRKKKLLTPHTWYRPADAPIFIPATPGEELKLSIQKIVDEELPRLNMKVKCVETGGVSLKSQLVKLDLTGCLFPACILCASGLKGGSHTRSGPVYTGTCTLCGERAHVSEYHGESGDSGYSRMKSHATEVGDEVKTNAFHTHLELNHPEKIKDISVFKMKVEKTFQKPLDRQIFEGVLIGQSDRRDHLLNSNAQFHAPAVPRVRMTREIGM